MAAPKLSQNTFYNLIDTLMQVNRRLWDKAVEAWTSDQEGFIDHFRVMHRLNRPVAYTYWHAIEWGMEYGYPFQFSPGNEYFRRNPDHALDGLVDRI